MHKQTSAIITREDGSIAARSHDGKTGGYLHPVGRESWVCWPCDLIDARSIDLRVLLLYQTQRSRHVSLNT